LIKFSFKAGIVEGGIFMGGPVIENRLKDELNNWPICMQVGKNC